MRSEKIPNPTSGSELKVLNWDEALYGELLAVTGGKKCITYYVRRHRPEFTIAADFAERVAALHKAKTHHYTALAASSAIPMRPGVAHLFAEADGRSGT